MESRSVFDVAHIDTKMMVAGWRKIYLPPASMAAGPQPEMHFPAGPSFLDIFGI